MGVMSYFFPPTVRESPSETQDNNLSEEEASFIRLMRRKGGARAASLYLLGINEEGIELLQERKDVMPPKEVASLKSFLLYSVLQKFIKDQEWDETRALKAIRRLANQGLSDKRDLATLVQLCYVLFKRRFRGKD